MSHVMSSTTACGGVELELVRVHSAAGLALVRASSGVTKWIAWPPAPPRQPRQPSIDLDPAHFAHAVRFQVTPSADGHAPQNLLLLLHGRGDSEVPFARLAAQMALPQTAAIALRAPLELPLDLGHTWCDDLDADYDVIPPDTCHAKRSASLQAAAQYVWAFVETLHTTYAWPLERVFVLGFSQGACVAFDVLMALVPRSVRLGGVVLVAGGLVVGPHTAAYDELAVSEAETPVLAISGALDTLYPANLSAQTQQRFQRTHTRGAFTAVAVRNKQHAMIASADEMRHVMAFFAAHLYLKDIALEQRSDLVEIRL